MDGDPLPAMAPAEEKEEARPAPKDPYFPYTLIILAGVMAVFNGILLLSMNTQHLDMIRFEGGSVQDALAILDVVGPAEMLLGVAIIVMGIISRMKAPSLLYAAGVVSIVTLGPLALTSILGVIAIVLMKKYEKISAGADAADHHD